jgi:hypothetical protein
MPIAIQYLSATYETSGNHVAASEKYKQQIVGKWKQIKIMFIAFTTLPIDVCCEIIKSDLQFTIIDFVRRLSQLCKVENDKNFILWEFPSTIEKLLIALKGLLLTKFGFYAR